VTGTQLHTRKKEFLEENRRKLQLHLRTEGLGLLARLERARHSVYRQVERELIYWKSVHSWFADPERRRTGKVVFDKRRDVL
jgi:hypothetical protein